MTDTAEQERLEDEARFKSDREAVRDSVVSGMSEVLAHGEDQDLPTLADACTDEILRRLRARQREEGDVPVTLQEAARFRQVKRARDNVGDPYATHKALEDFLRNREGRDATWEPDCCPDCGSDDFMVHDPEPLDALCVNCRTTFGVHRRAGGDGSREEG